MLKFFKSLFKPFLINSLFYIMLLLFVIVGVIVLTTVLLCIFLFSVFSEIVRYIINYFKKLIKIIFYKILLFTYFIFSVIYLFFRRLILHYHHRITIFLLSCFIITFYLCIFFGIFCLFMNLDNKSDPTSFIAFIISLCITMLFFLFIFLLVLSILVIIFTSIKFIYQSIKDIFCFLWEWISYNNFSRFNFILSLLYSFLSFIGEGISFLRKKAYGLRFVCLFLNGLTRFSVFFFKYLLGFIIKWILLSILYILHDLYNTFLIYIFILWEIFTYLLNLLFKDVVGFLCFVRSSNIYILLFGHIEGYCYRFWLDHLKYRVSYLLTCCKSLYYLEDEDIGLFLVIVNVISIFIVLICLFYSTSIYIVTIGLHMDTCFRFILSRCDGFSFVPFVILTSFVLIYMSSIIFFISCLFISAILFVRLYYFLLILFNKLSVYFLGVQGSYFYFRDYLIRGVEKVDTTYIKNCWDSIEDVFKYEDLFVNKVLDIQEDRLDKEDEKKDPNKFYYKKLFVKIVAFLSFSFCFGIMFVSYVYF